MASDTDDYIILAAIDFGTTYSGYAYTFKEESSIFMNSNWTSKGFTAYKTPTSVLTRMKLGGEHEFLNFGFEAEDNYVKRFKGDDAENTCLFENFKMKLHEESNRKVLALTDKRGKHRIGALTIFTMALKFLKDHLYERLNQQGKKLAKGYNIKWVLTIPAIWSVNAKSFMRKAACQADLIDEVHSNKLILALEPEAAAIHCQTLEITEFMSGNHVKIDMTPNLTYMIIDAGGGTVDIAVHKILDDGAVEEMCIADGGPWGANAVNRAFEELLKKCWGSDFIAKLQQTDQVQWTSIQRSFEQAKRTPNIKELGQVALWHVGVPVVKLYDKVKKKDIEEVRDNNLYINDDYQLMATRSGINELFRPTVHKIIDKVKHLLTDKVTNVAYIFVVGGFASSAYLTDSLKMAFGTKTQILIPNDPQLAVLSGAVKFGKNPDIVRKRVMPRTYGMKESPVFDPLLHDPVKKYDIEGTEYCYTFDKLVTVGQHVDITQEIDRVYLPIESTQKIITFEFYETKQMDALYPDEPHLTKIQSELNVPISDASEGGDRSVELFIQFGTTEIRARARRHKEPHGEWYHTVMEYSPQ